MMNEKELVKAILSLSPEQRSELSKVLGFHSDKPELFTDVDDFIHAVVYQKRYNSRLHIDSSIAAQYRCHMAIFDAIDSLDGYYKDEDRWKDKQAVKALQREDPFSIDGIILDKKYELLDIFVRPAHKELVRIGKSHCTEIELAEDVYNSCCILEDEFKKLQTPLLESKQEYPFDFEMTRYCGYNCMIRTAITQYDTTYEFSAEIALNTEGSTSYDRVAKGVVKPFVYPLFGTDEFFHELDHELISYRAYWAAEDTDAFSHDDKFYILNGDLYEGHKSLLDFFKGFYTYNDLETDVCTKQLYSEICKFIDCDDWPDKKYVGLENWFIVGDVQYFVTVLADGDVLILNTKTSTKMYLNKDEYEEY